jgi:hypothetical protein
MSETNPNLEVRDNGCFISFQDEEYHSLTRRSASIKPDPIANKDQAEDRKKSRVAREEFLVMEEDPPVTVGRLPVTAPMTYRLDL